MGRNVRARAAAARSPKRTAGTGRTLPAGAWFVVAVVVVALGTVGLTRLGGSPDAKSSVAYDRRTRELTFDLPAFDGGRLDSAALRGTPTVVNFYASWCQVCNQEMPDFEKVHRSLGDKVHIVGVNAQSRDSDSAARRMVASTGVTYPTAKDRGDQLLRQFNLTGALPTTLFVDARGTVVDVHNGGLTQAQLEALVEQNFGVS